jgi:predicted acyltransferase
VFRGLTVALMILVNNPGSWAHVPAVLRHATWHGLTPADLVFPFFLFIVGVAIALSFSRRMAAGAARGDLLRKIATRSVLIFICGLFLNGFPFGIPFNAEAAAAFAWSDLPGSLENLRIPGVLQRIALCYLLAGLTVVLAGRDRNRILVGVGFILTYELLMRLPLVTGWGAGSFALADNFVRWADLRLLGEAHLYRTAGVAFDPEGLVSTLPAAATTLAGYFAGRLLTGSRDLQVRLVTLTRWGAAGVLAGGAACFLEPVNKQLWTVTYVLVTGGLALMSLAGAVWMIDVRNWRVGTRPAVVFGSNPLVAFLGSGLLARILILVRFPDAEGGTRSLKSLLHADVFSAAAGPVGGSVLFAVFTVLLWLAILWVMYNRRVFVKI